MKAYDFDAVVYDGEVYCTECLPYGIRENSKGVDPIFADSEWDTPPVCGNCGEEHTYMSIMWKKCVLCGKYCDPEGPQNRNCIPPYGEEGDFIEGDGFQEKWSPFVTVCQGCLADLLKSGEVEFTGTTGINYLIERDEETGKPIISQP
jgi:hypothetical protein